MNNWKTCGNAGEIIDTSMLIVNSSIEVKNTRRLLLMKTIGHKSGDWMAA